MRLDQGMKNMRSASQIVNHHLCCLGNYFTYNKEKNCTSLCILNVLSTQSTIPGTTHKVHVQAIVSEDSPLTDSDHS